MLIFWQNKGRDYSSVRYCHSFTEQACRHRSSSQDRFFRTEASPLSVPKTLCENGKAINRTFCFQGVSQSFNICSLEERSIQCSKKCIFNNLEQGVLLYIPSFLPNNTGFEQDREGQDKKINFNNAILADTVVVPPNIEHVDKETRDPSTIRKTTIQSFRTNPLSCNKSNPYISGMDGFRGYLFEKGVSVKAANFIYNSRRQSSLSGYESSWKKWSSWCDRRVVNPFRCTLVSILDYLTSLFEEGLEYNTIGVHRSAISAYHEKVDDMPVGQHPLVTSLMAGIFNSRPPQPRYIFVWDVQVVLNFIKKDWRISSSLTDQELIRNLQHLGIRYMTKGDDKVIAKLHKSWLKGKPPPSLTIFGFPEDPQLCVIETLDW